MIANSLAGFAFFVAGLGPGYLFIRVAEKHKPRPGRSTLFEAVEMVVVGAVASLLSIAAVLALADVTSFIDSRALALSPGTYLLTNAWRSLVVLATLLALAYGGTWVVACRIYGGDGAVDPGGSSWWEAFRRASAGRFVRVTVELRDGRRIAGQVGGFTAESVDNRELGLVAPIAAQAAPGAPARDLKDDFLLLREEDVAFIAGRYRDRDGYPYPPDWGPRTGPNYRKLGATKRH